MDEKAFAKLINNYSELETKLLEEIVQHFNINEEFINSDYWRFEKLEELGLLNESIIEYIAKVTSKTPSEIKRAIQAVGYDAFNINNLNKAYKGGFLQIDPNILIQNNVVENLIKHSYNELTNRFLEISDKVQKGTRQAYLDVVEKVYLQTSSGVTYQEAIRSALMDLGNRGITTLTYKTVDSEGNIVGIRNYDVESAVRREIVTANHNLVNEINRTVAEELEVEYLYLSEHIKCRPQHFPWQGTIIKRTELVAVTKLGEVDGMGGPNCKHYPTPYFGRARGAELKKVSLEEATEQYSLSQQQRYLERGIRKWKRKERIFETAEDKEYQQKCKEKIKEWQLRNKEFTENNNLMRDFSRENVERVTKVQKSDIITKNENNEVKNVQYVGKIDVEKLGKYKDKVMTDDVILTNERIKHIQEHHPGDYETYRQYIQDIVENPDYVVDDNKNINTVLYMKTIKENNKNIQIVIRLNTNENEKDKMNSIITLWKIHEKTYKQVIRNKEILWKKLDKEE